MSEIKHGFAPFYGEDAKVLILGSFPSVLSRKNDFYYGNRQNRFWKTLAEFFGESEPIEIADKKDFLIRRKIALWDIVTECEIVGSQDATIKNYTVADVEKLLKNLQIRLIIVNGGRAYSIFTKHFPQVGVEVAALPSTSPANTRFDKKRWFDALSGVFERA